MHEEFAWALYAKISRHYLPVKQYGPLYHMLHRSVKSLQDHFSLFHGLRADSVTKKVKHLLSDLQINLVDFFEERRQHMQVSHPFRSRIDDQVLSEFELKKYFTSVKASDKVSDLFPRENRYLLACRGLLEKLLKSFHSNTPVAYMKAHIKDLYLPAMRTVEIVVNSAFKAVFNREEEDLCEALVTRVSGFLPFGGALLSFLVSSENELVTFMEVQCVKGTVIDVHGSIPRYSEMPNVSFLKLSTRKDKTQRAMEAKDFQVTTVVRKIQDENSTVEEVSFEFKPLENINHLL